jgi:hypothetical protein
MGFLNKIFNNKKNENLSKYTVRANFKNEEYFISEIDRFTEIIEDYKKNLAEMVIKNTATPFNYWSIAVKYLRLINLKYSLGEQVILLKNDYLKALTFYTKGWEKDQATYSDMLDMVSLAVIFKIPEKDSERLLEYIKKTDNNPILEDWKPDYLLGFILNYLHPEKEIPETILFPLLYQTLVNITKMQKKDAEIEMVNYLNNWYTLHKNEPWYDTHKKPKGYAGYWSWEAAAVVKIMGLNDIAFRDHPNYPNDVLLINS